MVNEFEYEQKYCTGTLILEVSELWHFAMPRNLPKISVFQFGVKMRSRQIKTRCTATATTQIFFFLLTVFKVRFGGKNIFYFLSQVERFRKKQNCVGKSVSKQMLLSFSNLRFHECALSRP